MNQVKYTKLNIGCGYLKLEDYWNVDLDVNCRPDQVIDLEQTPWPYQSNFFHTINANNVLEHLGQTARIFTEVIKEMYRVSCDGAEWFINIPHHRCDLYYDDYTHVRFLTAKTFKMFDQVANKQAILRNSSDSKFGLMHNVDLEVISEDYELVEYWKNKIQEGEITSKQLNIELNTRSNVAEALRLVLKVHKPGRNQGWSNTGLPQ